jgi:hypothetical protein
LNPKDKPSSGGGAHHLLLLLLPVSFSTSQKRICNSNLNLSVA